jgi:hypothetical protein
MTEAWPFSPAPPGDDATKPKPSGKYFEILKEVEQRLQELKETKTNIGPFSQLMTRMGTLERRMEEMESKFEILKKTLI